MIMNFKFWNKKVKAEKSDKDYFNNAVDDLVLKLNEIHPSEDWRSRANSFLSGGSANADTMHNIFEDFGYPETLTFEHLWNMFRRFGVAKAVVNVPVNIAWTTHPEIKSNNPAFEKEAARLIKRLKLWQRLKGVDTRQRVGRYGGLFMEVRDSKKPDLELKSVSGSDALINIKPMYESQLKVTEVIRDSEKENNGQPAFYQFDGSVDGNRNIHVVDSVKIDPSRVVIAAEGADDGSIYGISALECVFNDLMDLRKISGAGGEGLYQNTRSAPFFEASEDFRLDDNPESLKKLEEAIDDWLSKHRKRLMLQGVKPHYPNITLPIPKEFLMGAINNIAAGTDIPSAILIGQQTGRLAAEKDFDYFLIMIQARRENFLTDLIEDVFNWCIEHGILPNAEFEVVWDDITLITKSDKMALAKKMADVNQQAFSAGSLLPFSPEEIREASGEDPDDDFEFIAGDTGDDDPNEEEEGNANPKTE